MNAFELSLLIPAVLVAAIIIIRDHRKDTRISTPAQPEAFNPIRRIPIEPANQPAYSRRVIKDQEHATNDRSAAAASRR